MIKIKRKLILLLCIIFLFNSSVTGRAKETTLQKAFSYFVSKDTFVIKGVKYTKTN